MKGCHAWRRTAAAAAVVVAAVLSGDTGWLQTAVRGLGIVGDGRQFAPPLWSRDKLLPSDDDGTRYSQQRQTDRLPTSHTGAGGGATQGRDGFTGGLSTQQLTDD